MTKYKIVFLGTTTFSEKILEQLFRHPQLEIKLIITQPDRKAGRQQELKASAVKNWALQHQLPLVQPLDLKTITSRIEKIKPDFLITAAYGQKVPATMLKTAKIEALNVHGSLLPRYRGGAPIQMAIWNGDSETGVSVMRMVEKMDAGPIFGQRKISINPMMTTGELMEALAQHGGDLLNQLILPIARGEIRPQEQNKEQISFAYNIRSQQEKITWQQPATLIHNQVRALAPQPGAFTIFKGERIKIFKTQTNLESNQKLQPGTVVSIGKNSFTLQTGNGTLEILELQKAGKNKISGGQFGQNNLKIGDQFT